VTLSRSRSRSPEQGRRYPLVRLSRRKVACGGWPKRRPGFRQMDGHRRAPEGSKKMVMVLRGWEMLGCPHRMMRPCLRRCAHRRERVGLTEGPCQVLRCIQGVQGKMLGELFPVDWRWRVVGSPLVGEVRVALIGVGGGMTVRVEGGWM
jgi:hypothetical protein